MVDNIKADGTMNSIIGKGTKVEGKLEVPQSMRIDGVFIGTLKVADTLILGATGELIDVDVKVKNAVIGGKIKGRINAANKLTLEATARVEGDITSRFIIIDEGVEIFGKVDIGRDQLSRNSENPKNG